MINQVTTKHIERHIGLAMSGSNQLPRPERKLPPITKVCSRAISEVYTPRSLIPFSTQQLPEIFSDSSTRNPRSEREGNRSSRRPPVDHRGYALDEEGGSPSSQRPQLPPLQTYLGSRGIDSPKAAVHPSSELAYLSDSSDGNFHHDSKPSSAYRDERYGSSSRHLGSLRDSGRRYPESATPRSQPRSDPSSTRRSGPQDLLKYHQPGSSREAYADDYGSRSSSREGYYRQTSKYEHPLRVDPHRRHGSSGYPSQHSPYATSFDPRDQMTPSYCSTPLSEMDIRDSHPISRPPLDTHSQTFTTDHPAHYRMDMPHSSTSSGGKKKRGNLPKESTSILNDWYNQHITYPYPKEEEKQQLQSLTGLSISQVCLAASTRREVGRTNL